MAGCGRTRVGWWTWAVLMVGCGPAPDVMEEALEAPVPVQSQPAPSTPSSDSASSAPIGVPPVRPDGEQQSEPRPVAPMFQPGFHEPLRVTYNTSALTTGVLTVRLRVPVSRPGQRVRLTFRSGDSGLVLSKATVAKAGAAGTLASTPVVVTFAGTAGFSVGARTLAVSDPVAFPVGFRDELAVSFEVKGALGANLIGTLPGSYTRAGSYAATSAMNGTATAMGLGLATVDVEGPPSRAFVAVGDSITEGYIGNNPDDTRKAWPALAEAALGVPIANSGVSGQGFYEELENLDQEVLAMQGFTDCIILLGTNDLYSLNLDGLKTRMSALVQRLQPRCRTWVSPLLPKEKTNHGDYEVVKRDRLLFNAWLRSTYAASLIDLEAVTRQPGNVHLFIDGLEVDGIHPSAKGHQVMAAEVVRVLRAAGVRPATGVQVVDEPPATSSSTP